MGVLNPKPRVKGEVIMKSMKMSVTIRSLVNELYYCGFIAMIAIYLGRCRGILAVAALGCFAVASADAAVTLNSSFIGNQTGSAAGAGDTCVGVGPGNVVYYANPGYNFFTK